MVATERNGIAKCGETGRGKRSPGPRQGRSRAHPRSVALTVVFGENQRFTADQDEGAAGTYGASSPSCDALAVYRLVAPVTRDAIIGPVRDRLLAIAAVRTRRRLVGRLDACALERAGCGSS